jgi:aconitate decarboxylase
MTGGGVTEVTGYTDALARFCARLHYDDLPPEVVGHLKKCIADTLACGVFGSTLPWSRQVLAMCERLGRSGPAIVWGTGQLLGADLAALVNGAQVHSYEFDDLHRRAIVHPGGVTIPALAGWVQASQGPVLSGREFLAAVAAGYEACIRVGLGVGMGLMRRGWHNNGVVGTFGGAVAVARALSLNDEAMAQAIGIAATQSGGLMAAQYGSSVKRFHAGRAAQSGVYAALLAADGYRGIADVLETPYGGFATTFSDDSDLGEVVSRLGIRWETAGVGFKPYPACGSSHTGIDAALDILAGRPLNLDEIDWIRVGVSSATLDHVGWAYEPDTVTTAQMSLRFAVAAAFVHGAVTVATFEEQRLRDPRVLALIEKLEIYVDPAADEGGRDSRHSIVLDVGLASGEVLTRSVRHAKGSDVFPLSDAELEAKWMALLSPVLSNARAEEILTLIGDLEQVPDVRDLFSRLAG